MSVRQVLCVDYWAGGGSCCDQAAAAVACRPLSDSPCGQIQPQLTPGAAPRRLSRFFLVPRVLWQLQLSARPGLEGQALRCPSPKIKLQSTFPGSTLENIKGLSQSSLPGDEAAAAYSVIQGGWKNPLSSKYFTAVRLKLHHQGPNLII